MTDNHNNNFTITDNNSQFAKLLPEKYIEPLTIISRIKGYNGIYDYILNLIKDRLEMFADTRDNLDGVFQKYMNNTMIGKDVTNEWARNDDDVDYNNKKVNADKEKEDLK